MKNITKDTIFRWFRGELTADEASRLDAWVGESEKNARMYREARMEYEFLAMNADISGIRRPEPAERVKGRKRIRIAAWILANAAAIAVFFLVAARMAEHHADTRLAGHPVTVTVPAGQRMSLTLTDGSKVDLNAGSKLVYPALFHGHERNVSLEGEAVFHIMHDENRPFTVNTFAAKVKVLGTEFSVIADSRENEFSATLINGCVSVTGNAAPDHAVTLRPDQKVSMKDGKLVTEETEASEAALWTEGIIDISCNDFRKLMTRLEKAYGVRIVIEREEMPAIRCSGKVRISDGIDHVMSILSQLSDFKYARDAVTGTIYIR